MTLTGMFVSRRRRPIVMAMVVGPIADEGSLATRSTHHGQWGHHRGHRLLVVLIIVSLNGGQWNGQAIVSRRLETILFGFGQRRIGNNGTSS